MLITGIFRFNSLWTDYKAKLWIN